VSLKPLDLARVFPDLGGGSILSRGASVYLQRTLRQRVAVEGVGLHSGKPASLVFCPAPANTGIHFVRVDLPGRPALKVFADNVQATTQATTLGGPEFSVGTVEHCLSAMAALRVDNLIIELRGPEIPIVDGSAKPYLDAILKAGVVEQETARSYWYVQAPIHMGDEHKSASVVPYNGLRITCTIDFAHPKIGLQSLDLDISSTSFERDIAPARTFGFLKDVNALHARGLALGGSLENAVVLDDTSIMNPEGLRFSDEFVRHKVLDALGDLTTLGAPLMGHVTLYKAGHDLMNRFVKKIIASPENVRLMQLGAGGPAQSLDAQYEEHRRAFQLLGINVDRDTSGLH
jgi:UDP-3-O-[3-hydroxymyristoyl] N-acetylglucosamine deacetylase